MIRSGLEKKRLAIWSQLLSFRTSPQNYHELRQKVIENPELIQAVEEVIQLDI